MAARISKPIFERTWFTVGLLLSVLVPLVIQRFVLSKSMGDQEGATRSVEYTFIVLAIFVGMLSLVLGPVATWKYIGYKQIKSQVQKWVKADRDQYGKSTVDWKVQTPGLFNSRLMLTLILPPSLVPTVFHPDAYLPSYINAPDDVDAVYYYPFKAQAGLGLPRMSVVGNVPLYADEKRGFADYQV